MGVCYFYEHRENLKLTNLFSMSIKMIPARILSIRSFCRYNAAVSKGIQIRCASQAVAAEKINRIVSDISQLTLIEVAELNKLLKTTLNIPDAPMMSYGAAPAAAAKEEAEEETKVKVQTSFTVKLTQFTDTKKIALIKEIKNIVEGMNLVQAKKFVENLPAVIRADIT